MEFLENERDGASASESRITCVRWSKLQSDSEHASVYLIVIFFLLHFYEDWAGFPNENESEPRPDYF